MSLGIVLVTPLTGLLISSSDGYVTVRRSQLRWQVSFEPHRLEQS